MPIPTTLRFGSNWRWPICNLASPGRCWSSSRNRGPTRITICAGVLTIWITVLMRPTGNQRRRWHWPLTILRILALRTRLLQRAGHQDEAIEVAQKAASLAPDWDEPYYLAGVSLYFVGRFPEADKSLGRAVELNPGSPRTLFMEGRDAGEPGKACRGQTIIPAAPSRCSPRMPGSIANLGFFWCARIRTPRPKHSLRKAIELAPNYALPHYELGKLLVQLNHLPAAAEELSQAVHYEPNLSAAYYQLSRVYARLGETEDQRTSWPNSKDCTSEK